MIESSNNWATNRLIDYVGRHRINTELAALGLTTTRLNRYMTGTGAPSAWGTTGPGGDYRQGRDNLTTPREYTQLLRRVHQNGGLLSPASYTHFWTIMGLNGTMHGAILTQGVGTWPSLLSIATKPGSNTWGFDTTTNPWTATATPGDFAHRPQIGAHLQRSEAGRMTVHDGQVIVYAAFIDEADALTTTTPLQNTLRCILVEVAREYTGQTTGTRLPQCRL